MNMDERLCQRARQEDVPVPAQFSRRVDQALQRLPARPRKRKLFRRYLSVVSAAAVALVFILPNSSAAMADTMAQLPVVGPLFQVITVRTYQSEEGKNHVSISSPQILDEDSAGAQEINRQIEEYTTRLITEYEQNAKSDGYFNLDVTWEVVTNTPNWFTLRINSDLIMASGNHQEQYYHIDAVSGERKTLADLFPQDYDYITVISDELKAQMQARMDADSREQYWLEGTTQLGTYYFDQIDANQDFYFDAEGKIVIPFDKYEVGPGSTGSPRFTITAPELYQHILYQP